MARREGWVSRRRSGVQGKALEYHIDSLPFGARSLSALHEADHPDYDVKRQDPMLRAAKNEKQCRIKRETQTPPVFLIISGHS